MTTVTVLSPEGYAQFSGEPESVAGGVIVRGTYFATPPFTWVDGTPPDESIGKWLREGSGWTEPPPSMASLADLKVEKNLAINAARLEANFTTFAHAGKTIACDQLSRSDIDGANGYVALYGTLPPGWPGGWKAVDNTYVPIVDVDAWKAFYTSMFAAGNASFAHAQQLKAALAEAATVEQIAAVVW